MQLKLNEVDKQDVCASIKSALESENIKPEIQESLLDLVMYMEKNTHPLMIDMVRPSSPTLCIQR